MTRKQEEWARVEETNASCPVVISPAEAAQHIRKVIEKTNGYDFEHIVALFLDNKSRVIKSAVVGIGGFAGANIMTAVLFKKFFTTKGASYILVGHNHPSGETMPSQQDIQFTKVIRDLCTQLGTELVDSLIVTAREHNRIPPHII